MNRKAPHRLVVLVSFAFCLVLSLPAFAQMQEVKEKPPMYTYVSNWVVPRAQWTEFEKQNTADQAILDKALAGGTVVAFGNDENLVHQPDSETHDSWWASMSMAGLLRTLDQFYTNGTATSPALISATKHWDEIFVSRYYNWPTGSVNHGYLFVATYKLKEHAPDNALDTLSKSIIAPLLEKMVAAGAMHGYEIDTQAVHTGPPGTFLIVWESSSPDSWDKLQAAIGDMVRANPLIGPAFDSMVDGRSIRSGVYRASARFK